MEQIGGIAGAGVTDAITSLQVGQAGQQWFAVRAVRADVAMASTAEVPFLKVHRDDRAGAVVHMGAVVFIFQGIGFGLDNMVNSVFPNVRGVTAQYFLMSFFTFGKLGAFILEWPQCVGNIRGLQHSVDIDADVQGGLGDVFLKGVCKMGIVGVDLGIFGQEVSRDDVGMGQEASQDISILQSGQYFHCALQVVLCLVLK